MVSGEGEQVMSETDRVKGPENDYSGGFKCVGCDTPFSQAFLHVLRQAKFNPHSCPNSECRVKVKATFTGIQFDL